MREEFVRFYNEGQAMVGMLHLPDESAWPRPHPGVVMLHGFTGHRIEGHQLFVKQARRLARVGLATLRFDFRGSGESEGDFAEMTIPGEISDAHVALAWLAEHPAVDPRRIGVIGLSMGGCVAAHLAGQSEQVRALALWAAAAHLKMVRERMEDGFQSVPGGWDRGGNVVGPRFRDTLAEVKPLEALQAYGGPALVVHGEADETVPVSHAHDYVQMLGKRARLVVVPEADHTFASYWWEHEVILTTTAWMRYALLAGDPSRYDQREQAEEVRRLTDA